jgi:hypothetical protein
MVASIIVRDLPIIIDDLLLTLRILQSTLLGLALLTGVSVAAPTSSALAIDNPILVPRKGCPYPNEQRCQQAFQASCSRECDDVADGVFNSGCVVSCLGEAATNCERLCR